MGDVEERARALLARGERDAAVTHVIEAYGPGVLGYLCSLLDDEDDARDAYAVFQGDVFRGLETWRGDGSLRAWAYRVAWNAAARLARETYRRRRQRLRSSAASRLPASVPTASRLGMGRRELLNRLRAELTPEEHTLLVLRVDRGLEWEEVAAVLSAEGRPAAPAALRKRFERLKTKLASLAKERGLVE